MLKSKVCLLVSCIALVVVAGGTAYARSETHSFSVSQAFGDRDEFRFNVTATGTIRVVANWPALIPGAAPTRLALVLNGPRRPYLRDPYARRDGRGSLVITYNVTREDLARGTSWKVSIVNFSRRGRASGPINIEYPPYPPGERPARWRIRLTRLRVADAQEEAWYSDGDEPYFIVIGFRSRFDTRGSTSVFWNGYLSDEWAEGVEDRSEKNIPVRMGLVSFPNVQRVTAAQITAGTKPELIGALVVAMESDATGWGTIRSMMNRLRRSLERELRRLVEDGELNLANPGPGLRQAIRNVKSSMEPSFWQAIKLVIKAAGDPDDLIGFHFFLFMAVDPALAGFLPLPQVTNATMGVLEESRFTIGRNPIVFRGDGATYQVTASVTSSR